jgi:hypothetical protein
MPLSLPYGILVTKTPWQHCRISLKEPLMKIRIATFTATAVFALLTALHANAQSSDTQNKIEYKKDGGYQTTTSSKSTTPDGTAKSSETDVDVSVDSKGYVTKDETVKDVTDPKGLRNKKKIIERLTTKEKPNGGYEKTTKSTETDAQGTDVSSETKTNVEVNPDTGDVTTTSTAEKTVDPKGLMNKQVMKKKVKTINGKVVEEEVQTK